MRYSDGARLERTERTERGGDRSGEQEKENAASAVGDRWSDQDQDKQSHKSNNHRTNRDRKRHTADGVCLDANRNVDYLATLSSGNASITARGSPAAGRARGLFPSSGSGGGGGVPSSGGSGRHVGDRPGFSSSTLRGTDAMSGTLLMQKKRRRQQELDAQEREEVCAVCWRFWACCVCVRVAERVGELASICDRGRTCWSEQLF